MQLVQQTAPDGATPAKACMIIVNEAVGQGADPEQRRVVRSDHPARRVKAVPVQTEVETVVPHVVVIEPAEYRPVIAIPRLNTQIRLDSMLCIRYLLQIDRIRGIGCADARRGRERRVGDGELDAVGHFKIGLVQVCKGGIDH